MNPQIRQRLAILERYKEPDQRDEDRAVGPVQPGPGLRAAQHGDLVPQHEQLDVLGRGRPAGQD